MDKIKMSTTEDRLKDTISVCAEFNKSNMLDNVYQYVIDKVSDKLANYVIKSAKEKMLNDDKFIKDISKIMKNKISAEMKPNKELEEIRDAIKNLPQANEYGNLNVRVYER